MASSRRALSVCDLDQLARIPQGRPPSHRSTSRDRAESLSMRPFQRRKGDTQLSLHGVPGARGRLRFALCMLATLLATSVPSPFPSLSLARTTHSPRDPQPVRSAPRAPSPRNADSRYQPAPPRYRRNSPSALDTAPPLVHAQSRHVVPKSLLVASRPRTLPLSTASQVASEEQWHLTRRRVQLRAEVSKQ